MGLKDFNTEGPVDPSIHYCIPPLERVDRDEILHLIRRRKYFVLHAPRQTGKTSTLKALADTLNATGKYGCVYANFEVGQTAREDVPEAMRVLLGQIARRAEKMLQDTFVRDVRLNVLEEHGGHGALNETLARWASAREKPLVLLIDEIDSLEGDSLISVLRQLRAGYDERPDGFPQSVILCGVRDVRDYRIYSSSLGASVTGGSAFNIRAKSLRLGDFTQDEVRSLLGQHTAETGQEFEAGAVERIWELTRGQPWLVNALALEACFEDKAGRDRSRPIGAESIDRARETLIVGRVTHLDQLAARLSEDRVRRVIEPLLEGSLEPDWSDEDMEYVRDLGLIAPDDPVRIANPIYREVVPRQLTSVLQSRLAGFIRPSSYLRFDGSLDLRRLMQHFQGFFRDHSEHWVERFGYREAGPQLILQAFLQRLVNSGGRIEREFGVGRPRTDLLVVWRPPGGGEARYVIECKVLRPGRSLEAVIAQGVRQTGEYMDVAGADEGHLVVFELRPNRTWSQRLFHRQEPLGEVRIDVWGV
ncbi:MAG: ATP-binding protein [Bryobacterales bacterium]|nr:ATP-binding protein [Bryobacterales bacterium]